MYQIIVRILAPQIAVYDFVFGRIVDGQFTPMDCSVLSEKDLECVEVSSLLGTQAFIKMYDLTSLTSALLKAGAVMSFYPNFIVFDLPEGYVSEKEKDAQ